MASCGVEAALRRKSRPLTVTGFYALNELCRCRFRCRPYQSQFSRLADARVYPVHGPHKSSTWPLLFGVCSRAHALTCTRLVQGCEGVFATFSHYCARYRGPRNVRRCLGARSGKFSCRLLVSPRKARIALHSREETDAECYGCQPTTRRQPEMVVSRPEVVFGDRK